MENAKNSLAEDRRLRAPPEKKRPLASKALNSAESGEASPRTPGGSSSVVEELRDLLGNDVVLLPIKRGNKGPSGKAMYGWETFTAAKMQEPEYLAKLQSRREYRRYAGRWTSHN